MLKRQDAEARYQLSVVSLDELVPSNHLVRKIEKAIDFTFIYDLVKDKYSQDNGRPSVDPVVLIKIVFIQYLFGIKSMRQTIKELETNVAYRWFIGYDFTQPIPHFSTFGKNYARRFQDTDLFETIFAHILGQALKHRFVDPSVMFIDSTHVKANANKKKYIKTIVEQEPKKYLSYLTDELNQDRIDHGKKPLPKNKEIYSRRKETIERVFADLKEKHGLRWTTLRGIKKVTMQVMLVFASMNLKKLATWLWNPEKEKRKLLQLLTFYQQKIKQTLLISVA